MEAPDRTPRIRIPGYVIETEIGRGGVATVYLATQQSLDRKVALKVMSPALAAEPDFTERFEREGRTVARFSHPNIVTIYDVGVADYQHYIAMEYLNGGSLKRHLHRPVDADFALTIVRQMAHALGYAHEQGYVHRDVKPENILFRGNGEAVLTDFGIAKSSDSHTQLTRSGTIVGTPRYMSPEQAQGENATARSDIYALGVILYELLTARPPFDTPESLAVLYSHINDPIPELPASAADMQPLVDSMMAKDPEDRVPDCGTLIDIVTMLERERKSPSSTRRKPRTPVRSVEQQRRDRAGAAKARERIDADAITEEIPVSSTHRFAREKRRRRPVARLAWLGLTGIVVGSVGWYVANTGGFTPWLERLSAGRVTLNTPAPQATPDLAESAPSATIPAAPSTDRDVDSGARDEGAPDDGQAAVDGAESETLPVVGSNEPGGTSTRLSSQSANPTSNPPVEESETPVSASLEPGNDTVSASASTNVPTSSGTARILTAEEAQSMVRRDALDTQADPAPMPEPENRDTPQTAVSEPVREATVSQPDDSSALPVQETVVTPSVIDESDAQSDTASADAVLDDARDSAGKLLPRKVAVASSSSAPSSASLAELDGMMKAARELVESDRLSRPPGDNAIDRYRDVLSTWPGNLEAQRALRDIASTYHSRAREKFNSGDNAGASLDIERGLKADPDNAELRGLGQNIRDSVVAADAFADAENYFYGRDVSVDHVRAFERYSEAATKGHSKAQLALASLYANGLGTGRDDAQAMRWLRAAAEAGDPEAQYGLGLGLLFSSQRNPAEASKWINRAVDSGFERAYRVLGWMHQTGTGVNDSPTEAIKWGFKGVLGEIRQGDDAGRKAMVAWESSFESAYDEAVSPSANDAAQTERDSQQ